MLTEILGCAALQARIVVDFWLAAALIATLALPPSWRPPVAGAR